MYSQQLSLNKIFVLTLLILYSVNKAAALRCYKCVSATNEACSSPSSNYIVECDVSGSMPDLNTINKFMNSTTQKLDSFINKDNWKGITFDCGKFTGTGDGQALVARYCLNKHVSCANYIDSLKEVGFIVDTCDRCDTDACNSSRNIGFWTLCISLIMIVKFKY